MGDVILEILKAANNLTPLGVTGLLAGTFWYLLRFGRGTHKKLDTLTDNHLHELPSIAENIRAIAETLQRMEIKQAEEFSFIRARLNGTPKSNG